VREDDRGNRIYGPKRYFPGALYDDVMRELHASLPPFVGISFNLTDESENAGCWMQLSRRSDDPDANLTGLVEDAIAAAKSLRRAS